MIQKIELLVSSELIEEMLHLPEMDAKIVSVRMSENGFSVVFGLATGIAPEGTTGCSPVYEIADDGSRSLRSPGWYA